ncbi:hypothetical protein VTJ49DRAFT_5179 [Mycothermus thermophilus]|uniref:Uncharacterized protein n=1 Tax=Humicola insolens TaxID=85995 RepID=A0ABR3V3N6_HUMIN
MLSFPSSHPGTHPTRKPQSPRVDLHFLSASPRSCRTSGPLRASASSLPHIFAALPLFFTFPSLLPSFTSLTSSPNSVSHPFHNSLSFQFLLPLASLPSPTYTLSPSNRNARFHLHVHPWSLAPSRRLAVHPTRRDALDHLTTAYILRSEPFLFISSFPPESQPLDSFRPLANCLSALPAAQFFTSLILTHRPAFLSPIHETGH